MEEIHRLLFSLGLFWAMWTELDSATTDLADAAACGSRNVSTAIEGCIVGSLLGFLHHLLMEEAKVSP